MIFDVRMPVDNIEVGKLLPEYRQGNRSGGGEHTDFSCPYNVILYYNWVQLSDIYSVKTYSVERSG